MLAKHTPYGTPSFISTLSLRCASTFTRSDLSWRKQRIRLYIRPDTLAWITLRSNPSLHTLSKALDRSYNTATVFLSFPGRHSLFLVRVVLVGHMCFCVFCNHSVLAKGCYWLPPGPCIVFMIRSSSCPRQLKMLIGM